MTRAEIARAPWWLAIVVTLLVLALVDLGVRAWRPPGARLSSNFSALALTQAIDAGRLMDRPVVVLGDSVLWGYGVRGDETAVAQLRRMQPRPLLNLSFQGGSAVNTYFLLRLLLERGVRPSVVLFNVNSKTFNPSDSAYRRLHPALERDVRDMLRANDRSALDEPPADDLSARLGNAVASVWRLYAIRADLKQAIFHADDAASALTNGLAEMSGAAGRERAAHVPTPERFLGTYDLTPLDDGNIGMTYLHAVHALLAQARIPAIAFLTPTNHALLADYINVPEYRANLRTLTKTLVGKHTRVLDLDAAFASNQFLDNDHLTPGGNLRLAKLLAPALAQGPR